MEEKLRSFVLSAALRTSKLSKMRSLILVEHGYDLSPSVIRRLLNRQAFGSKPLKFKVRQDGAPLFADRPVHVVELDLCEEDREEERITIFVGEETIELPISAKTSEILEALRAAGVTR